MRAVQLAEAMKGMSHKPRQKPAIDTFRAEQIATAGLDATRGALMGVTTDVLGYPVDLAASAMRPFGYNIERPVGGSDWLANNLTSPTGSKAEWAGRIATGMLTPGPEELLRMGGMLPRKAPVNELITYHGSPHRINNVDEANPYGKFDMSKIGTGEGAQAYGHGIYLAETPDVAKSYASLGHVKGNVATIGGKPITDVYDQLNDQAARLPIAKAQANYDRMALLENLMNNQTPSEVLQYAKANNYGDDAIRWFEREVVPKYEGSGHLYTVDLPDEHIAKMLDWDAPLSEQPEAVRKAIDDAYKWHFGRSPNWRPDATGESIYRAFDGGYLATGQSNPQAPKTLSKFGIPGIKYFDGGSRSAGQGTRNFVIFDPEYAKILKRE